MRNLIACSGGVHSPWRVPPPWQPTTSSRASTSQSEALCAQAKSDTLQTVIEAGNVVLTARGLDSIEYNCEFLQVTRATRAPAWLVNALCQEPGYLFPDVLSVPEMSPTQLDLVSVKPADPDGGGGNSGSYFLCDGVTMP